MQQRPQPHLTGLADTIDVALPNGPAAVLSPGAALQTALKDQPGAFTIASG